MLENFRANVHKVLEGSFEGVFQALALSSYLPYLLTKFTAQQLLGYSNG